MVSKVRAGNYLVIQAWMLQELELKGVELLLYAVIYGFSQGGQPFTGSIRYLSEWSNASRTAIITGLKNLCQRGLLNKLVWDSNGAKRCGYIANSPFDLGADIRPAGGTETVPPGTETVPPGTESVPVTGTETVPPGTESVPPGTESVPNNIAYNIADNTRLDNINNNIYINNTQEEEKAPKTDRGFSDRMQGIYKNLFGQDYDPYAPI